MKTTTHSYEETIAFGKHIATTLHGGDIVLLSGDLGAGKTTLVKGIAEGFGITDDIVSPTFTLMNIYHFKQAEKKEAQFIHIDTYRLNNEHDLLEIGIEDYLGKEQSICLIEWPEKIPGLLRGKTCKTITLTHEHGDTRTIEYTE